MNTKTDVHCQMVTGFTRLGRWPIAPGERCKVGRELPDGRYEWLCGYRAAWIVEGPTGSMAACSRDVHDIAVQLSQGEPVTLTPA